MAIRKPPSDKPGKSALSIRKRRTAKEDNFIKGEASADVTKQISLKLPGRLLDAIDERATALSISRAAFIKQSCARFLEND